MVIRCVCKSFLTESNFLEIFLDSDLSVEDFFLSSSTFLADLLDLKISAISFDIVFDSKRISSRSCWSFFLDRSNSITVSITSKLSIFLFFKP